MKIIPHIIGIGFMNLMLNMFRHTIQMKDVHVFISLLNGSLNLNL